MVFAILIWMAHWVSDLLISTAKWLFKIAINLLELIVPGYVNWVLYGILFLFIALYLWFFWSSCRAVGLLPTLSKVQLAIGLVSELAHEALNKVEKPAESILRWLGNQMKSVAEWFTKMYRGSKPIE